MGKQAETTLKTIGMAIRLKRVAYGMRIEDLVSKSHVSTTTISNIENGKIIPAMRVLLKLCKALDLEIKLIDKN